MLFRHCNIQSALGRPSKSAVPWTLHSSSSKPLSHLDGPPICVQSESMSRLDSSIATYNIQHSISTMYSTIDWPKSLTRAYSAPTDTSSSSSRAVGRWVAQCKSQTDLALSPFFKAIHLPVLNAAGLVDHQQCCFMSTQMQPLPRPCMLYHNMSEHVCMYDTYRLADSGDSL